jgi:hypothetical protein
MLKRVVMMGLVAGLSLPVLQGGTAEAGTWSYIKPPGTWYYYGTIDACALIGKVPNPDNHLARNFCGVSVTKVESLCINPAGNTVTGEAATQLVYYNATPITSGDLLGGKYKGDAAVCGTAGSADADCTTDPGDGSENRLCNSALYCVNPNWQIQYVMTTEFDVACQTQACQSGITDDSGNCCGKDGLVDPTATPTVCNSVDNSTGYMQGWAIKDTQTCGCTLPAPYSIENRPEHCQDYTDPLNPPENCVPWECYELDANGDLTTNRCEPPQ